MSMSPTDLEMFPSMAHREVLRHVPLSTMTDEQKWHWYAYSYGFKRIYLQTRDDVIAIDPLKLWFDPLMAAEAEVFWARVAGRGAPPLPEPRRPRPTPEEIAHVEECCRQIRANLKVFFSKGKAFRDDG
jgi:hypothetical protein